MLETLKSTLQALVAIDTTSTRPNRPLIDWAEPRLTAIGFQCQRQIFFDEAGVEKINLIALRVPRQGGSISAPAKPSLALVAHTDCVPFDAGWTDALTLTERAGSLYGRGACDTKAFLAAALVAVENQSKTDLSSPLLVILTADEERGCQGAKQLQKAGLGRARYAILGEPTQLTPVRAHKGYCLAEVSIFGQEGHSAYPDVGASAIVRASHFIDLLDKKSKGVLRAEQDFQFDPPYTSTNVGVISGGKAPNVIPGLCRFTVEWRPIPNQPAPRVMALLQEISEVLRAEDPGYRDDIQFVREDPGVNTSPKSKLVQFLEAQSGNVATTVPFGTEAPYLTALGAEAVVFGPGDIRVAHRTGEHVPVAQLLRCEEILEQAISHFCGEPVAP